MRVMSLVVVVFSVIGVACSSPPPPPDGDDGLAYFGFSVGQTFVYNVGETTEEHVNSASDASFEGSLAQVTARRGGFAAADRSFTVGATGTSLSMIRLSDCIARCRLPQAPIAVAEWPLRAAGVAETTVQVESMQDGVTQRVADETHRFLVGAPSPLTVPSGSYDEVFPIGWTETTPDGSRTSTLFVAADVGVVAWVTVDGERMELAEVR
jgi:hypothetical protein